MLYEVNWNYKLEFDCSYPVSAPRQRLSRGVGGGKVARSQLQRRDEEISELEAEEELEQPVLIEAFPCLHRPVEEHVVVPVYHRALEGWRGCGRRSGGLGEAER